MIKKNEYAHIRKQLLTSCLLNSCLVIPFHLRHILIDAFHHFPPLTLGPSMSQLDTTQFYFCIELGKREDRAVRRVSFGRRGRQGSLKLIDLRYKGWPYILMSVSTSYNLVRV